MADIVFKGYSDGHAMEADLALTVLRDRADGLLTASAKCNEAQRLAMQNAQAVLLNGMPGVDSYADRINAADDILTKALAPFVVAATDSAEA